MACLSYLHWLWWLFWFPGCLGWTTCCSFQSHTHPTPDRGGSHFEGVVSLSGLKSDSIIKFNNWKKTISVTFPFFSCPCQFLSVLVIVWENVPSLKWRWWCTHSTKHISEVNVILSHYPCSVTGHQVLDPNPRLPEFLSGFEMAEVIEAKPLIAISL